MSIAFRAVSFGLLISIALPSWAQVSFSLDPESEKSDAVRRLLEERRPAMQFSQVPLLRVAAQLTRDLGLDVLVDEKSLQLAGVDPQVPVTFASQSVNARVAIEFLLRPLGLAYMPKDRGIVITTPEEVDQHFEMRLYPVRDLVESVDERGRRSYDFEPLRELIMSAVTPQSWQDVGGPGAVEAFPSAVALVISQGGAKHEVIERLLVRLREVRRIQGLTEAPAKVDRAPAPDPEPAPGFTRRYVRSSATWLVPRVHAAPQ